MKRMLLLLSHFSHTPLIGTAWTVAHQAPLSLGFSRQKYWSGLPCPLPSRPRDQTRVSYVSCIGRQVLYHQHRLGSPLFLLLVLISRAMWRPQSQRYPNSRLISLFDLYVYSYFFFSSSYFDSQIHSIDQKYVFWALSGSLFYSELPVFHAELWYLFIYAFFIVSHGCLSQAFCCFV